METILLEILKELKEAGSLDEKRLARIIHGHNKNLSDNASHYSKKKLMPFYLRVRQSDPERWASWEIDADLEAQLVRVLQVKPRRTASGVATITVMTKPWKCSSACIYCPSDLKMPKSYLSDEPVCQRAERNCFDPYLQVASRLSALIHMGHVTDKVELIVLGGTWSDYPESYQIWFVSELFRALNDGKNAEGFAQMRRAFYHEVGLGNQKDELKRAAAEMQAKVDNGVVSYNQAVRHLYVDDAVWQQVEQRQVADFSDLNKQQEINETAAHRVVGLVVETRPDTVDVPSLTLLRRLGCTKIQMGIQSVDTEILRLNNRNIGPEKIQEAFALLRVFGFKIHAHFMLNLYGATPVGDKRDYERFVSDPAYLPDEVKLYPCALVAGTKLCDYNASGDWRPYSEDELLDVLVADTLATPPYARLSRMIKDISAHDIVAGNKKSNLRQLVEAKIEKAGDQISEIRYREISTAETSVDGLSLTRLSYNTSIGREYFLQWITPENKIAGFLRLSLPAPDYVAQRSGLPVCAGEAMIREVHVYGKVAQLQKTGQGAQHLGLGKQLIETACSIAHEQGYTKMNVISSVGTREYYRHLGFGDNGLYQQRDTVS